MSPIANRSFLSYLNVLKPCEMGFLEALLLLGGGVALYFWNLSQAVSNLQYLPGNITGFSLAGFSPVITADLIIQNTSNISFTINSLAGTVTSDGTYIGNVSDFQPVVVPANNQGAVPLNLTLQPLGIVNELISIISGGVGTRNLKIQGSVNANGTQQAFSVEFKVSR